MKLSNRNFLFFILYFSLITLQIGAMEYSDPSMDTATSCDSPESELPTLDEDEQAVLEQLTIQPLQDLEKIDVILSTMHIKCANSTIQVRKIGNHLDAIAQTRSLIQDIKHAMLINPEQAHPLFICAVVAELTKNINALIDAKFQAPLAFNIDAVYTRLLSRSYAEPNIGTLAEILVDNESSITLLEKNAEQAGLTWYNKFYRPVRNSIIKPLINHPELICSVAAFAGLLAYFYKYQRNEALATLIEMLTGKNSAPENSSVFRKIIIGEAPRYGMQGLNNSKKLGAIGVTETLVYASRTGQAYFGTVLANQLVSAWQRNFPTAWDTVRNKLSEWDNNLLGGIHRQQNKFIAREPVKTFDDVIGAVDAKEFGSYLANAVAQQEKYIAIGATPPMAILLIGGPRTGKTNFAESVGGEINLRTGKDGLFYRAAYEEIQNLGFEGAVSAAKSAGIQVLFIDEFHLFFPNPARQVEALKAFNERYDPKNPIVIICATNSPEKIPKDLYKRFDHVIRFEKTTIQNRKIFLERELYKNGIKLTQKHINDIACEANNNSYEDLIRLIEQAKILAVSKGEAVSEVHIREKFDEAIRNIILNDEHIIPETTQKIIAANVAAETLVSLLHETITHEEVTAATIKSYKSNIKEASELEKLEKTVDETKEYRIYGKVCRLARKDKITLLSHAEKKALCKILIAGHLGEALILGNAGYDYHADKSQQAFQLALSLVSQGLDTNGFTPKLKTEYLQKAQDLLESFKKEVSLTLESNKTSLYNVYNALLQEKILYRDKLQQIIAAENTPQTQTLLTTEIAT